MQIADSVSRAQALTGMLAANELEFLRGLVAGESQATIALRLKIDHDEALEMRRSLMRKLGAEHTADAVRTGIYAGL